MAEAQASPPASESPAPAPALASSYGPLAAAGLALLLFPKAVKMVAYGALGLYGFHLYQVSKQKGAAAIVQEVKQAASSVQSQVADLESQQLQSFMTQVAPQLMPDLSAQIASASQSMSQMVTPTVPQSQESQALPPPLPQA